MVDGATYARVDDLIGTQRESAQIARHLTDGMSTVIVGALGSGKSHLIHHVVSRLRRSGVDPLVLRSGGPLADTPLGALDATHDPRAAQLREGTAGSPENRLTIIVDDAQELDAATAATIARAVYNGTATALFGLTISRDGTPTRAGHPASAADLAIDMWLRGLAERIDLPEIDTADAANLVAAFGGTELDSLSRAGIIGLAHGSRMLLREFTREAVQALSQGRDPVTAIRDARAHSRIADAVDAHVRQFPPHERRALAILHRLPRIAAADAVRIISEDTLDALIGARLVHVDGTADRLVTANAALAAGCTRLVDPEDVNAALRDASARMLSGEDGWWSIPLARRVATEWLRGDVQLVDSKDVSEDTLVRLARDAARSANDTGDHDLAAALARCGLQLRSELPLRIEALLADAARGEHTDPAPVIDEILARGLDCTTMLRWMQLSGPLVADRYAVVAAKGLGAVADAACADSALSGELALIGVQTHVVALDWKGAFAKAEELSHRVGASTSLRMRASVLAAMAQTNLGDADEAHRWYARARRLAGERDGVKPTTTWDRLWAYSSEIITHGFAGTDARPSLAGLEDAYRDAAMEGDPTTWTFAVFVAAGAAASVGDADRALLELRGALRRPRLPRFGSMAAYIEMVMTRSLALQGRAEDARIVFDLADTTVIKNVPLLDHARLIAEACVLVAEGRESEALGRAREAVAISESAPMFLAGDLFVLLALGENDDAISSRIREIAEATSVPVARLLDARARQIVTARTHDDRPDAYEALRMGGVWGVSDATDNSAAGAAPTPPAHPGSGLSPSAPSQSALARPTQGAQAAVHDLTRREREIAILVAEGLSNREIATRLFLSVRTVESHIYQARAKVDAASRGELGAIVAGASVQAPRRF